MNPGTYAIVETGGKQYRAAVGDVLDVELLGGAENEIALDKVLLVSGDEGTRVGTPYVEGVVVKAEVAGEVKGPKLTVFKIKRRKGYRRKTGHRQHYTRIRITDIQG